LIGGDASIHPRQLGARRFVVSFVVLHVASSLFAATVLAGSCGENCHTTVYLGPRLFVLILVTAIAIAAGAVRYAAGKKTRR
jgi:hypothetical protein